MYTFFAPQIFTLTPPHPAEKYSASTIFGKHPPCEQCSYLCYISFNSSSRQSLLSHAGDNLATGTVAHRDLTLKVDRASRQLHFDFFQHFASSHLAVSFLLSFWTPSHLFQVPVWYKNYPSQSKLFEMFWTDVTFSMLFGVVFTTYIFIGSHFPELEYDSEIYHSAGFRGSVREC